MNIRRRPIRLAGILFLIMAGADDARQVDAVSSASDTVQNRSPHMEPDYSDVVIPPNIAPLNFMIGEAGLEYGVRLYGNEGAPIELHSESPIVTFPLRPWKALLDANRGQEIYLDVAVRNAGGLWSRFRTITNRVAEEAIDPYVAYRLLKPLYNRWAHLGIYQRNIETFDESPIIRNDSINGECLNCHAFNLCDPQTMTVAIRSPRYYGLPTLLAMSGSVKALETRTEFNKSPFAYTSWHPSGRFIAFSVNTVRQFFHTAGENRDVMDLASDVVVYRIEDNTITTTPVLADANALETYPAWSPDGRWLYYCRGSQLPMKDYKRILYDLMRIPFEPETGAWGEPETIVVSVDTGLSVTHPKVSPDGRFVLFCMAAYGNFSIYQPSSDLYLLDVATKQFRRLDINSDRSDSYHSWASNSRWFVFSSKRRDGLFTRLYLSHCDSEGHVSKPFLLPQKDPTFYDSFLKVYNVPELITGPVVVRERTLAAAVRSPESAVRVRLDPQVQGSHAPDAGSGPWSP